MPSTVRIHVGAARDLPVMDKTSKLTDAYVEVEVAGIEKKTAVCRKTLNPVWREDFEFSIAVRSGARGGGVQCCTTVCALLLPPSNHRHHHHHHQDDSRLQNEPVEFKVMDMDVLLPLLPRLATATTCTTVSLTPPPPPLPPPPSPLRSR